jgi:hypothetical protein
MAKRYRESNNNTFSLFRHRTTLYFVFFLSLTYLFYLLLMVDFPTIFFFGLVGLVTSFFSKNMIIVLSVALSLTLLMNYSGSLGNSLAATTVTEIVVISDVNETLDVKNKDVDKGMLLDLKAQDHIPSGSPTPQLPMNVVLGEIPNGDAKNAPLEASNATYKEVGLTELGDKSLSYASV